MHLRFLFGIKKWHHAIVKLRVRLHKVDYVKHILSVLSRVAYFKIEPLSEIFSVVVRFQNEFILRLINLDGFF